MSVTRDGKEDNRSRESSGILKVLDTAAKMAAAAAVVGAALIANTFQSKMTAVTMLSQREQAESELRATMFSNLIGPIAGPAGKDAEIPAEREKLLVELLALNFHEHFEFKPLLEFVDKRLAAEGKKEERRSLRSIAKRVIDRQVASLLTEGKEGDRTEVVQLFFSDPPVTESQKKVLEFTKGKIFGTFYNLKSPDGAWNLDLTSTSPDWENQNIRIHMNLKKNVSRGKQVKEYQDIFTEFTLTSFDFPLTDNTLLADGNRLAVVLDNMDVDPQTGLGTVTLRLIWFPKNYFTPRERPINYSEFREKLGLKVDTGPVSGTAPPPEPERKP